MVRSLAWIFGNAVQDITVEVDIDKLVQDNGELIDLIGLEDTAQVKEGLLFTTQFNGQEFGVELELEDVDARKKLYSLREGKKYTLKGRVEDLAYRKDWRARRDDLKVHCEDVSWGGGGLNVCRFLRALAPSNDDLKIQYTDYAMSRTFVDMIRKLEAQLQRSLPASQRHAVSLDGIAARVADIMNASMYSGERLISNVSEIFALYSPSRCLEVFLAALQVTPLLFRPREPVYQRNWVFSSFRNALRSTQDKIICRSKTPTEAELEVTPAALEQFVLEGENDSTGAIVLNSIKHKQFFKSAYDLYRRTEKKRVAEKRDDFVGVFAMTNAMQKFVPDMHRIAKREDDGYFLPFILIFNETEAVDFVKEQLGESVDPIMRATGDLPNVYHFAQIVRAIRPKFGHPCPRIYVTTGPRGSLGFDGESNMIMHVSYYSRRGDTVFDTNACGDAYCAAVTLLEWAKRCRAADISQKDKPEEEMLYFMAVATAAAYCKARDRRGRIDAKTIRSLLKDTYLGSGEVGVLDRVLRKQWPDWVDREGRAHRPPTADFRGVTPALADILDQRASR